MDVRGGEKVGRADVKWSKQAQLLEEDRSLAPGAAFGDRPFVEVNCQRRFASCLEGGQVTCVQQAAMGCPGAVHEFVAAVTLHRLGNKSRIEGAPRRLDLLLPPGRR